MALKWSMDRCGPLGAEWCNLASLIDGEAEVLLLGKTRWTSVTMAVAALKSGELKAEGGFCVVFSQARRTYNLIWREDKDSSHCLMKLLPKVHRQSEDKEQPTPSENGSGTPQAPAALSRIQSSSRSDLGGPKFFAPHSLVPAKDVSRGDEVATSMETPVDQVSLDVDMLHFGGDFDLKQPSLQEQLLSKLSKLKISPKSAIEELQQHGGLNQGVWTVKNAAGEQPQELVLNLVRGDRKEGEQFVQLSRRQPSLMHDPVLAFPVMIIHCICNGETQQQYDLIAMPKVQGESLSSVIGKMWWRQQSQELMRIIEKVGACIAEFHQKYNNQHGDFQPSNIYYDEACGAVTFIDLVGIAPEGSCTDNDVQHFLTSLTLMAKAYGPKFLEDSQSHFMSGYSKHRPSEYAR
jgi:hypothetical protein